MRFRATLSTDEAPELFDRFLRIIGPEPWQKRYRILADHVRANPLLRDFVVRRHGLELTIGRLLETRDTRAVLHFDLNSPGDYAAFAFMAGVVSIHEGLSPVGKTRVAGTLRDGPNTDRGLRPFQNEVETATHLIHAGFDLTFRDLEGEPGFDFLAVRDGVELEIECKSVSGDLGRQVHERHMADLSKRIARGLEGALNGVVGGRLVRVTLPARLTADPAVQDRVAVSVKAALAGREEPCPDVCDVHVQSFDLATSPFASHQPTDVTPDTVRRFVDERLGPSNIHAFVLFAPGTRAIVVVVDSQGRDRVVRRLMDELKDAAEGQFSRERAAVLVVQFLELEAGDILELARHDSHDPSKASTVQLATNLFFDSAARSHIHTVVYRSHGILTPTAPPGVNEQGPTYSFRNPNHPQANDPRYRPFAIGAT